MVGWIAWVAWALIGCGSPPDRAVDDAVAASPTFGLLDEETRVDTVRAFRSSLRERRHRLLRLDTRWSAWSPFERLRFARGVVANREPGVFLVPDDPVADVSLDLALEMTWALRTAERRPCLALPVGARWQRGLDDYLRSGDAPTQLPPGRLPTLTEYQRLSMKNLTQSMGVPVVASGLDLPLDLFPIGTDDADVDQQIARLLPVVRQWNAFRVGHTAGLLASGACGVVVQLDHTWTLGDAPDAFDTYLASVGLRAVDVTEVQ